MKQYTRKKTISLSAGLGALCLSSLLGSLALALHKSGGISDDDHASVSKETRISSDTVKYRGFDRVPEESNQHKFGKNSVPGSGRALHRSNSVMELRNRFLSDQGASEQTRTGSKPKLVRGSYGGSKQVVPVFKGGLSGSRSSLSGSRSSLAQSRCDLPQAASARWKNNEVGVHSSDEDEEEEQGSLRDRYGDARKNPKTGSTMDLAKIFGGGAKAKTHSQYGSKASLASNASLFQRGASVRLNPIRRTTSSFSVQGSGMGVRQVKPPRFGDDDEDDEFENKKRAPRLVRTASLMLTTQGAQRHHHLGSNLKETAYYDPEDSESSGDEDDTPMDEERQPRKVKFTERTAQLYADALMQLLDDIDNSEESKTQDLKVTQAALIILSMTSSEESNVAPAQDLIDPKCQRLITNGLMKDLIQTVFAAAETQPPNFGVFGFSIATKLHPKVNKVTSKHKAIVPKKITVSYPDHTITNYGTATKMQTNSLSDYPRMYVRGNCPSITTNLLTPNSDQWDDKLREFSFTVNMQEIAAKIQFIVGQKVNEFEKQFPQFETPLFAHRQRIVSRIKLLLFSYLSRSSGSIIQKRLKSPEKMHIYTAEAFKVYGRYPDEKIEPQLASDLTSKGINLETYSKLLLLGAMLHDRGRPLQLGMKDRETYKAELKKLEHNKGNYHDITASITRYMADVTTYSTMVTFAQKYLRAICSQFTVSKSSAMKHQPDCASLTIRYGASDLVRVQLSPKGKKYLDKEQARGCNFDSGSSDDDE